MGRRHGNKKLRNAARARMAIKGESYQSARRRIVEHLEASVDWPFPRAGFIPIRYGGTPAMIAWFDIAGHLALVVVSGIDPSAPFPRSPLLGLSASRLVH